MTINSKDNLFVLIKSLSKSEKRQFKLYVGRLGVNTDSKFLSLFNILEKQKEYDEKQILDSGVVKKSQLSNLKAHLYKQLLVSLRLNPAVQNTRIQIREQLDFATILYQKGLYRQSLKILDKAKSIALEQEEKNMAFEIVEFEKHIETQFITRSIPRRAEELVQQTTRLSELNHLTSTLSNLSINLYGMMLKVGYVRSDQDLKRVQDYFERHLPVFDVNEMDFREKLWWYKTHLWYSFLTQDFLSSYKFSSKWVSLFTASPEMIHTHPVFYIKGNHYLLESLFFLKYHTQFKQVLHEFIQTTTREDFPNNDNLKALIFLYTELNKLNSFFIEGDFSNGLRHVNDILRGIETHKDLIDEHHVMLLHYKIACLYFGNGDHRNCIRHLELIIKSKKLKMREDLMCFARVLSLVAHYESGQDYYLEVQLKQTYKFLLKMNDLHSVQNEMLKFLRNLGGIFPGELRTEFQKLYNNLKQYEHHPYEKRAFLYLDVLSWLEAHLQNKTVGEVIRDKYLQLNR
jgi:hypothetical protein